jgi:putative transposase
MKRKRYSEEQIISILKEQESGRAVADICRQYEIGQSTFHKWKSKFGGMEVSEAKRLKEQEAYTWKLKPGRLPMVLCISVQSAHFECFEVFS